MYIGGMVLKSVLESFVDDIAEESSELLLERPRFAYAVVVIADEHEICEASCVRQLDVKIFQTQTSAVEKDHYDSEIQRALQELTESRNLLVSPRQSMLVDISEHEANKTDSTTAVLENLTTENLVDDIDRSAVVVKRSSSIQSAPSAVSSKSKCELFLQKIPGMTPMVLTDENGKKCRGVVEIPLCRGYCKTSESGTYTFPYRVQNSSVCALIVTGTQVIHLTDCDDGADEKIRSVTLPTGQRCGCKRFPFE